jgi:hypothetical protein
MENTNTQETNYQIGYRMQKEGYGISDSWNSAMTTNPNNEPTNEEIEEWMRGYNTAKAEQPVKDLAYWKANAEEDYITTPISVLRYISELEKEIIKTQLTFAAWEVNGSEKK